MVCARDIDSTLVRGDLIAWHEADHPFGRQEGIINAITRGRTRDIVEYIGKSPFIILNLPLVSRRDIEPIRKEMHYEDMEYEEYNERKDIMVAGIRKEATTRVWKIDFSQLELRTRDSYYAVDAVSTTREKYLAIEKGLVRRDTLNAYNEITRDNITIDDIKVLR